MKPSYSSLKDLKARQSSFLLDKTKTSEDLIAESNVSKLELSTCFDQLSKEKSKNLHLNEQLALYTAKCNELERHTKTLTSLITEKDSLISRLWDDILKNKKKTVDDKEIMQRIDTENEISAEGEIGELSNSVGKSGLEALSPDFAAKRKIDIDELKRLRNELNLSQDECKLLEIRLKEASEKYARIDVEAQEMREKLKFQKENSVSLTQQVLKLSNDKENELIMALIQIDEMKKIVDSKDIEFARVRLQMGREIDLANEEMNDWKQGFIRIKQEIAGYKYENDELKSEISEYSKIVIKKEEEIRKLRFELEESNFEIIKSKNVFKPDYRFLVDENAELKNKLKELKQGLKTATVKSLEDLVMSDNFQYDQSTQDYLIDIFGKDTQILFDRIHQLIKSYKTKIKSLKAKVQDLSVEISNRPLKSEIYYSSPSSLTPIESQAKFVPQTINDNPNFYTIERLKIDLEKQKIAKRKARAEKEQISEDLAHAILEMSELSTELLEFKLKADQSDLLAFVVAEAQVVESFL